MEAIIDTNILIYETIEDSMYHKEVVEKLKDLESLYIPTNILIEFILVMKKLKLENKVIMHKISEILEDPSISLISIAKMDFKESLKIIIRENRDMKEINDKIILALAKRKNLPIYTYDRQLKQQARKYGVKVLSR
ncbi:MAG: type II toxin-antitoxin system VapC family toxin [Thermoprotei archaeon]|nr:MAG: type II toxin-antitoxin system VapC family toxin [Thermoprotei archaeon]